MTSGTVTKIAVSGAAGNIGYALLPLLVSGHVFGPDSLVELRLLERSCQASKLEGIQMELVDCSFPYLTNVVCTCDPVKAFDGADVIVLVGGMPRMKGMARRDLIQANTKIFSTMGKAIGESASPNAKVLVVANPANTNALVALREAAGKVPAKNFTALTRLDHQRATAQVAQRLSVSINRIRNVTIWGNHSESQYPDAATDGTCLGDGSGESSVLLRDALGSEADKEWLDTEFVSLVQNRGKAVIEARGSSSAMSAAMATAECLKTWLVTGTAAGETVSMAVYNDKGYYGIKKDIVFSFPCECRDGEWTVKEGLELTLNARQKIKASEEELVDERKAAMELLES